MKQYQIDLQNSLDEQLAKQFQKQQQKTAQLDSDQDPDGQLAKQKKHQQQDKLKQQTRKRAIKQQQANLLKPGDPYQMDTTNKYKRPTPNFLLLAYPIITFFSCTYLQNYHFYVFFGQIQAQFYFYFTRILTLLCLWSFYLTQATSIAPPKVKQIPQRLRNIKCGDDSRFNPMAKYCPKCQYYKTPRTSHCSNCRQCVLRLDHHCIWIQRCVGYGTHLPFLQFIFFQTIGYFIYWYHNFVIIGALYEKCNFFGQFPVGVYILWFITNITMALIGSMIVTLFVTQIIGIARNYTTLDGIKNKQCLHLPIYQFQKFWKKNQNIHPYDRGQIQNLKIFFNTNNALGLIIPRTVKVEDEFFVDPITPYPSTRRIEQFTGEYGRQYIMFEQMKKTIKQVPKLYKGKKFIIKGQTINLE